MANYGNHEQHVKAGQQSQKSSPGQNQKDNDRNMGMSSSRNNNQNDSNRSQSSGTQGGTHEQHVNAGRQSHKNSK